MREDDIFPYKKMFAFKNNNSVCRLQFTAQIYSSEFNKSCRGRHCLPGVKAEIFKYNFCRRKPGNFILLTQIYY